MSDNRALSVCGLEATLHELTQTRASMRTVASRVAQTLASATYARLSAAQKAAFVRRGARVAHVAPLSASDARERAVAVLRFVEETGTVATRLSAGDERGSLEFDAIESIGALVSTLRGVSPSATLAARIVCAFEMGRVLHSLPLAVHTNFPIGDMAARAIRFAFALMVDSRAVTSENT
ncbi:hypothetical protein BC830DRAFT_1175519, partial [Chytriomyces sp. MP71]